MPGILPMMTFRLTLGYDQWERISRHTIGDERTRRFRLFGRWRAKGIRYRMFAAVVGDGDFKHRKEASTMVYAYRRASGVKRG